MDIPRGCCWRCEVPKTGVSCKKCGIAQYCREKCCTEDIERHRPQCEVWTPKICSNPSCNNTENLKECSNCHDASYCSTTCQRQQWASHKRTCKERVKSIKLVSESLKDPFASMIAMPHCLETPYYFGNAIAQDLLNLQENEMSDTTEADVTVKKDFSILSAGCGNLRNLICTIASLPLKFGGKLRVTMNDIDPFVQARNLLFLFMMCHFSSDPNIATIVTTIWYSLHLPATTYTLLIDSLQTLVSTSSSKLKEYCDNSIDIKDEHLEILKQVWQGWLDLGQKEPWRSPLSLRIQREQMLKDDSKAAEGMNSYRAQVPKRHLKSIMSWFENGDFLPSGKTSKSRHENPTLAGRRRSREAARGKSVHMTTHAEIEAQSKMQPKDEEFMYCVPSHLMPFGEWDYLQASRFSDDDSLIVMYHSFTTNQIKQVVEFIKTTRLNLTILLGTCLELIDKVHGERFDRIFTSNISDYVGTKILLMVLKPLLNTENRNAVIVTQYWNWHSFFEKALADHPLYLLNGKYQKWITAAQKDTQKDISIRPRHWYQEYFNNSSYFVDYLRADLRACNQLMSQDTETTSVKVETFQQVKNQCSGLRMRDFRQGVNKVAPWRYRCNVRPVNMLPALSRMVEWYIPQ